MEAAQAQVVLPESHGDLSTTPIIVVFESYKVCATEYSHITVVQYDGIHLMKLNVQEKVIDLPRTEGSLNDRNPSLIDMTTWTGSIATSKFALIF